MAQQEALCCVDPYQDWADFHTFAEGKPTGRDYWERHRRHAHEWSRRNDDVFQDGWIKAIENAAACSLAMHQAGGSHHAWLARIFYHLRIDYNRKASKYLFLPYFDVDGCPTRLLNITEPRPSALSLLVASDNGHIDRMAEVELAASLRELDQGDQRLLHLHYVTGTSWATIARRQEVPESTVRNQHRRALIWLRRRLRRRGFVPSPFVGEDVPVGAPQ